MTLWIQTYTGRQFYPLDPRPEDVDIRDIARALSLSCRFNGHCRAFYSVAEHSVRMADLLPETLALSGLLHDAAEAYIGDLGRPVKRQIPAYAAIEDKLLGVILGRFGLALPLPPEVVAADDVLLVTEQRDLTAPPPAPWGIDAEPLPDPIQPLPPAGAERAFLERFHRLSR